jgi:hypothetical protein
MADTAATPPGGWLARNWKYIAAALAFVGWLIHAWNALRSGQPVPEPPVPPVPVAGSPELPFTGWVDDQDQVRSVIATCRHPVFAQTPAGQIAEIPDHVYQWDLVRVAINRQLVRNQGQIGACTAFGAVGATEYQQCVRIVAALKASQPPPEFADLAQEVTYSISRVQVMHGQLRGQDGATGAAAAQACRDYGVCPRGAYGSADLTSYSESRCRQYGDHGCAPEVLAEAAKHKVGSISPVRTTEALRKGLAQFYTATIASNVGFGTRGPWTRDADGCLRASGTWSHQMIVVGYAKHPTRGWLYCIQNSWGPNWVGGPRGAGNPPDGSFWCDERTMQRILDAQDSWFFDGIGGFEARKLDWNISVVSGEWVE